MQVAQTFDDWVGKLWEQNGDGRAIASPVQSRMAAEIVATQHRFDRLERTPGLAQALCECASKGFGVPSFDRAVECACAGEPIACDGGPVDLTAPEREVLACLSEYAEALRSHGLVQFGHVLRELARCAADVFPCQTEVLFLGDGALTAQQVAFFQQCPQLKLVHDENLFPGPLSRAGEVAVRMAFPSGRYAQARLLLQVIDDALEQDGEAGIVISSAHPLALYEKLAAPLWRRGISCSVQDTLPISQSDFGKAYMAACAVRGGEEPWDAAALTDVLHSSFVNMGKAAVWGKDRRMRGDRLVRCEDALQDVSGMPAFAVLDRLARGDVLPGADDAGDDAPEDAEARFRAMAARGMSAAYEAEQRSAYRSLLELLQAAGQFGCDGAVLESLAQSARFSCARVIRPRGDGQVPGAVPQVRIMAQHRASRLAAGSVDVLVVCDLTTDSYPLRESRTAASSLLARLGAGPRDTALARARRAFSALVQVPRSSLVLERCLNDANADPLYPSAMLQEFADAYRAGDAEEADAELQKRYGFPAELLEGRYEAGEEDLLQDVRPGMADGGTLQRIRWPQRQDVGAFAGSVAPYRQREDAPPLPRLSASQLENYLDCPYKWFVLNRCKATELDEGFGPREVGSFLHEVFQEFYQRFGEKVAPGNVARAQEVMFGPDGASGVFADVVRRQYERDEDGHAHSGRLVAIPGTSESYEVEHLRVRVRQWLQFEVGFLPGFSPIAFECRIPDVAFEGCLIRGTVDRIDVDASGRAVIIDYKGSLKTAHQALKRDEFNDVGKVQALMYARIVQQAGAIAVPSPDAQATAGELCSYVAAPGFEAPDGFETIPISQVVGAVYVSYNKGNEVKGAFDGSVVGVGDIPTLTSAKACTLPAEGPLSFQSALEYAAERVRDAVASMCSDDVAPRPSGPEACGYCPVIDCEKRCG